MALDVNAREKITKYLPQGISLKADAKQKIYLCISPINV